MSLIDKKRQLIKVTFGIIVGNRDVFPDELAKSGRVEIIEVLKELGCNYVILNEKDTRFGVVETLSDAKKSADLFKLYFFFIYTLLFSKIKKSRITNNLIY